MRDYHWLGAGSLALILLCLPPAGRAAGAEGHLQQANNDLGNVHSLQRGARNFVNYCMGCHSAKYVRYNTLEADLGLTEQQVIDNLMFSAEKPHDTMTIALPSDDAEGWFGKAPPDLSLIARARGTDYVYTFLKTFYVQDERPTGVNNLVLENTAMPHVLADLQGLQRPVYTGEADADGNVVRRIERLELAEPGRLSPEEYDAFVRDLSNFLEYISEPVQLDRRRLGIWVIAFLLVFLLFAYLLKKEYWKDVH